jgi:shikimate dehydrogenase
MIHTHAFNPSAYAATKIQLGLIGSGIGRSLAPVMQELEGQAQGLRLHYQLIDTADVRDAQALPKLVESARMMGFAGLNITFPFKQAVLPLLDDIDPAARAMSAVNCVTFTQGRSKGYNTDSAGWGWGFARDMPGADLSRVLLLGCGGAGSAVAFALLQLKAKQLVLADDDITKAQALCAALDAHFGPGRAQVLAKTDAALQEALAKASGFVHATPTGMLKLPGTAVNPDWLHPGLWVADVVYVPLETELLAAARLRGCQVHHGGHMNIGQGILNFKLFTGREADAQRMTAQFMALVAAQAGQ